jgi:putative hydrolase of the HAD superfamily
MRSRAAPSRLSYAGIVARPDLPSLQSLEAVLFDAGGTLVELDYAFIAGRARRRGVAVDPEALRRGEAAARRHLDGVARRRGGVDEPDERRRASYLGRMMAAAGIPEPTRAALVAEVEEIHAVENLWRVEVAGARRTLAALQARGLRTAVVSNADGRVEAILAGLGLTPHLSLVVDSHREGVEKPDPEIFHRALERLGIAASRAAYVGDIYSIDAVGARAAGLVPILLDATGGYTDVDCVTVASLGSLVE